MRHSRVIRRLRWRLATWLMPRPISGGARAPQWCDGAIPKRITGAGVEIITSEPAILVHATVIGVPAVTTRLDLYNLKTGPIDVTKRIDALIAAISEDDMFSNKPIRCDAGIVAQMDQAAGEAFIYYVPFTLT